MGAFIEGLAPQPQYPHEDLTDTNAELLIGSATLRGTLHEENEIRSTASRIGHISVVHVAKDTFEQAARVSAIDHGVQSFEALKALVLSESTHTMPDVSLTARALLRLKGIGLERHIDEAVEQFAATMPRTREVIHLSARKPCGYLADYALLGAALVWKFEQDAA
jgi:hypothetical protein